jgi:hypothetical protein
MGDDEEARRGFCFIAQKRNTYFDPFEERGIEGKTFTKLGENG